MDSVTVSMSPQSRTCSAVKMRWVRMSAATSSTGRHSVSEQGAQMSFVRMTPRRECIGDTDATADYTIFAAG